MIEKFFDQNRQPLAIGDEVEAQYCIGPYGQTRLVSGTLQSVDQYGGIYVKLDDTTEPFIQYGRYDIGTGYGPGDSLYVVGAFDSIDGKWIGFREHHDFEHGHKKFCRKKGK
jgi:hypothetical protein